MSDINFAQITLQGRLTSDPEMKTTGEGNTMCRFRVAVNRKIGKDTEKTSFIGIVVFGREAVNCGKYLTKGRGVMVSGRFETDDYTDKAGNPRTGFSVVAQNVIFGSGGRSSDEDEGSEPSENGNQNKYSRKYEREPRGNQGGSRGTNSGSYKKAEDYMSKNRGRGYDS